MPANPGQPGDSNSRGRGGNRRPGGGPPGGNPGGQGGGPRRNPPRGPQRPGAPKPQGAQRNSPKPQQQPTRQEPPQRPMISLPMASSDNTVPEAEIDGMTYIAYGEQGDDVAFELTADLSEALEILAQMQDDGFATKLYQANEIEVMKEE